MKEYAIYDPELSLFPNQSPYSVHEKVCATSPAKAAAIYAKKHGISGKPVRHLSRYGGRLLVIGVTGSYLYDFI